MIRKNQKNLKRNFIGEKNKKRFQAIANIENIKALKYNDALLILLNHLI